MRTLKILLVLVAVVLSGFSRDSQTNENVLERALGVIAVVPLKFNGCNHFLILPRGWTALHSCCGAGPNALYCALKCRLVAGASNAWRETDCRTEYMGNTQLYILIGRPVSKYFTDVMAQSLLLMRDSQLLCLHNGS